MRAPPPRRRHSWSRASLQALLTLALSTGCAHSARTNRYRAERWEAADRLFREDARWRGADAAYSAPLDAERTLWLFGDTFIVPAGNTGRDGATMIRNSVGVMNGRDPLAAAMSFHFDASGARPSAFFGVAPEASAAEAETWRWPGPALVVDGRLIVFLLDVAAAEGGLGFEVVGGRALSTTDFSGPPEQWRFEAHTLPAAPAGVNVAAGGLLAHGEHVYAYAPVEPGDHRVFLARWPQAELAAGRFGSAQWWTGASFADDPVAASLLFADGQTELTVHYDAHQQGFVEVQVDGFGGANVAVRTATAPSGPFTPLRAVHRPPYADRDGLLVYSAKAHPALSTPGGVALTYRTNHLDFWTMAGDDDLYYPRFILLLPDDS